MPLLKKDLAKKTESELLDLATAADIDVPVGTSKDALIDLLLATDATADVIIESAPEKAIATPKKAPKKYRIIVHNQEGMEASSFVKVCPRGKMTTIPREVEVVVSQEVVDALDHAKVTRHVYEDGQLVPKPARRFPFTVLGPA